MLYFCLIITSIMKVIYMLILIMAVFFLCWTPILTYNLMVSFLKYIFFLNLSNWSQKKATVFTAKKNILGGL